MGNFNLLHPWLLAGLAGASLPVLIHLIGRRQAPTVHFAAFDFLVAVNERLARREQLRQFLLLLLRTLALCCITLAVARPVLEHHALATNVSRKVALVVDTSASMGYTHRGTPLLKRAKQQALEALSHLQPGDAVTLVTSGPDVRALTQTPTLDHAQVRSAIDALDKTQGVADLGTAIDKALAQLGKDGSGVRLAVFSDLAENSFGNLRPTAMDPPPEITLVDAAERRGGEALGNACVEHVTVERSVDSAAERQFKVLVNNHGAEAVAGRALELWVNGTVTQRGYVDVPPRASVEKIITHTFENPGVFKVRLRLVPDDADGYARDDAMEAVVDVARGIRVLAVNGEPRTTPYEDELFFVERALAAVPKGDPPLALTIVTAEELASQHQDLSGFDAVILANVGNLEAPEVARLKTFVDAGGGLLLTMGPQIRFEKANAVLADLLPYPLRDLHQALDAAAGTPAIGIGDFDWDHPILLGLGKAAEESLRASRTARYFNLDTGAGLQTRAVLRFENGAPALVEQRRVGGGRVMWLATSVDLDYSDLALRTAFVALLQRTVRYLAKAVEAGAAEGVREGGTVEVNIPTGAGGVALVSPSGERLLAAQGGATARARFANLREIGIYTAEVQHQPLWTADARLDVAVNPSLDESDYLPVRPDHIAAALGGKNDQGHAVSVTLGDTHRNDPLANRGWAPYLLLGLCLLFVGESLLAARA